MSGLMSQTNLILYSHTEDTGWLADLKRRAQNLASNGFVTYADRDAIGSNPTRADIVALYEKALEPIAVTLQENKEVIDKLTSHNQSLENTREWQANELDDKRREVQELYEKVDALVSLIAKAGSDG